VDKSRDEIPSKWKTRLNYVLPRRSVFSTPGGAERLLAAEMTSRHTQRVGSFGRFAMPVWLRGRGSAAFVAEGRPTRVVAIAADSDGIVAAGSRPCRPAPARSHRDLDKRRGGAQGGEAPPRCSRVPGWRRRTRDPQVFDSSSAARGAARRFSRTCPLERVRPCPTRC
jgi:hypothetical protein